MNRRQCQLTHSNCREPLRRVPSVSSPLRRNKPKPLGRHHHRHSTNPQAFDVSRLPSPVQVSMIDDQGARALDGAIRFFATRGDEGRTHALMRMRAVTWHTRHPRKRRWMST